VVDDELPLADEPVGVEAEGADVLDQLVGGLLEGHEDPGLAEAHGRLGPRLAVFFGCACEPEPHAEDLPGGPSVGNSTCLRRWSLPWGLAPRLSGLKMTSVARL